MSATPFPKTRIRSGVKFLLLLWLTLFGLHTFAHVHPTDSCTSKISKQAEPTCPSCAWQASAEQAQTPSLFRLPAPVTFTATHPHFEEAPRLIAMLRASSRAPPFLS